MYDLCVVGGGAAGMSAAITAAELGKKVIIVDKNEKPGKKIYATGNGRCNLTNRYMNYDDCFNSYNCDYSIFLSRAIGACADKQIDEFMEHLGLLTYTNPNGYVYPMSEQASSVVWALSDRLKSLNVKILNKTEICSIDRINGSFVLKHVNGEITASEVVLSCGGRCYTKLGGSKTGYELAEKLGHTILPLKPALCGMEIDNYPKELSGIRAKAKAGLYDRDSNCTACEQGEIQFTDYGLSGILIFNMSSKAGKMMEKDAGAYISVSFINDEIRESVRAMFDYESQRTLMGVLNGIVNDRIAGYIVNYLGYSRKTPKSDISRTKWDQLLNLLTDMRFYIKGLRDFEAAQVTSGGVDIGEINPDTLMSKRVPGLYFAGEMLDIDGKCGGYNLTFAILSGIKAGKGLK